MINNVILAATIFSVLAVILESVAQFTSYQTIFHIIETATLGIFIIEYIARIVVARNKIAYMGSFFGIVDAISIVPAFFLMGGTGTLQSASLLRVLRFLRALRIAKVVRHRVMNMRKGHETYHASLRFLTLQIYFTALVSLVVILASVFYLFEGHQEVFRNIPLCILWIAESIFGGSISSFFPDTTGGRIVAITARFGGMVLFGFLLAVVGNSIKRFLFGTDAIEVKN